MPGIMTHSTFASNPLSIVWSSLDSSGNREPNWVKLLRTIHDPLISWRPFKLSYKHLHICCYLDFSDAPHSYWSKSSAFANTTNLIILWHSVIQAISYAIEFGKAMHVLDADLLCRVDIEEVDNDNNIMKAKVRIPERVRKDGGNSSVI